jgi:hypothetical protein
LPGTLPNQTGRGVTASGQAGGDTEV